MFRLKPFSYFIFVNGLKPVSIDVLKFTLNSHYIKIDRLFTIIDRLFTIIIYSIPLLLENISTQNIKILIFNALRF